jgi:hypothetical protein
MPTATKTSPKAAKTRAKAKTARKPAAKATAARSTTKTKATHAKGARTRAAGQAQAAVKQTQTATRETAGVFGDYAERAVLIPVGAALIARDRVVTTVNDTVSNYSSSAKAQAQLRRFERRALTARKRLEREVRKARVRVERELRLRRKELESTVNGSFSDIEARRESIVKNSTDLANKVPELANQVQERILSLV